MKLFVDHIIIRAELNTFKIFRLTKTDNNLDMREVEGEVIQYKSSSDVYDQIIALDTLLENLRMFVPYFIRKGLFNNVKKIIDGKDSKHN